MPKLIVKLILIPLFLFGCYDDRHEALGQQALAEGRYEEAAVAYARARELSPTAPALQLGVMRARVHLIVEQPARITPENVAELRYEALYLSRADSARKAVYFVALGSIAARLGLLSEADDWFKKALAADSSSPLVNTGVGLFYFSSDRARAREAFSQALRGKPGLVVPLIGLAQLDADDGKLDTASSYLVTALASKNDFGAHMLLGDIRARQNKAAEAAVEFARAAALDPRSGDAARSFGEALLASGKHEEAEVALRRANALAPSVQTALGVALSLEKQGKNLQALPILDTVLAQDDSDPRALFASGETREALGKQSEAASAYRKLIALSPKSGLEGQLLAQLQKQAEQHVQKLGVAALAINQGVGGASRLPPRQR